MSGRTGALSLPSEGRGLTPHSRIPAGTYPEERNVDGAFGASTQASEVGDEANLDFESAWPLIWPQKAVNFQVDDNVIEVNETSQTTPYFGFWNSGFSDCVPVHLSFRPSCFYEARPKLWRGRATD